MHRLPHFLDDGTVFFTFMVGVVSSHHVELVTSRSRSSPSPESFSSNSQLFPVSLFTLFLIFQPSVHNISVDIQAHHRGHPLKHRTGGKVTNF